MRREFSSRWSPSSSECLALETYDVGLGRGFARVVGKLPTHDQTLELCDQLRIAKTDRALLHTLTLVHQRQVMTEWASKRPLVCADGLLEERCPHLLERRLGVQVKLQALCHKINEKFFGPVQRSDGCL